MNPIGDNEKLRARIILVACGIIWRGRELLIAQRKPDSRLEPLKWEFPGGKIEFSENPASALKREIKEELNFEIEAGDIFCVSSHNYQPTPKKVSHVLMLAYSCAYRKGTPEARDVHDFRWVTVEKLDEYDFAAADHVIVNKLRNIYARPDLHPGGPEVPLERVLSDRDCPVGELKREVNRFVAERDWEQFHSPKNLSMSIAIEAAELMEHFQWLTVSEARFLTRTPEKYDQVIQEIADIAIYLLSFCHTMNVDLSAAISRKLKLNREKYPLEKFWGKHTT
ncbi:MAG: NUDIX domain-containing protein [Candidatus Euphemobacter frigidus]|nr:NUDIX domain-containing protein [Candidatus Euphemobacter frigidus]MDP8276568.1 NUDIX domain-containing protein [Candidatus Euphemobacter frigidus]